MKPLQGGHPGRVGALYLPVPPELSENPSVYWYKMEVSKKPKGIDPILLLC
jgi:hypothetical protein